MSNFTADLVRPMEGYARVMPAVNQLELHPRFSSPSLRKYAAATGMALTAYGSGNSTRIEKSSVIARIAAAHGTTPIAIVLRWTLQRDVAVIPRTATPAHMAANLAVETLAPLTAEELIEIDALNEDHPYYWDPEPLFPAGTYKRDC